MNQIITIRDRRQVTIPRIFLNKFGLGVGDKLIVKLQGNEIKIEPLKSNTVDLLTKIHEIMQNSGMSEKEFQESGKIIRKKTGTKVLQKMKQRCVFIDSNIWFSAIYKAGNCSQLLQTLSQNKWEIVISELVLREILRNIEVKNHPHRTLLRST